MVEWKNMPLNGRTCSGWKKMLLVVAADAHFGCKFAMILKKKQKKCELKILRECVLFSSHSSL